MRHGMRECEGLYDPSEQQKLQAKSSLGKTLLRPSVLWVLGPVQQRLSARGHDEIMVVAAATRYARNDGGDHNDELG
jgi:hypothetical protein